MTSVRFRHNQNMGDRHTIQTCHRRPYESLFRNFQRLTSNLPVVCGDAMPELEGIELPSSSNVSLEHFSLSRLKNFPIPSRGSMEAVRRSQRTHKRPLTYWDEYVATDKWYVKELVADIPPDELQAALEDEDFDQDFLSDKEEADEQDADEDYDEDPGEDDSDGEGEEDLQWSSEGERDSEEEDGSSEGGPVG
jgi:hypothetical protein